MRRLVRQKEIKKRKNFLPTIIVTLTLWLSMAFIIYFIEPTTFGIIPLFLIVSFSAFLFTASVILDNLRRGIIFATTLTIFLILRYFGIGNLLNLLLISGVAVAVEIYFWYTSPK